MYEKELGPNPKIGFWMASFGVSVKNCRRSSKEVIFSVPAKVILLSIGKLD